jgi:tol-pal system protein YbgF
MALMRRNVRLAARLLSATAAVVALGACATKSDIRDLQTEISALVARQDSLISQLRFVTQTTQDTLRTQSDQLFDFRGQITRELRQIGESLATLEAVAGESQRGITSLRDQLASVGRAPRADPSRMQDPMRPTDESVGGAGVEGNAEQLYSVALEQYHRDALNTAERAFEQFVSEHPNHARAPDAHFFLADILYQQNRPQEALEAFGMVQTLFPTAPKVPDALYRMAVIQIELGNTDEAVETLERIMNTYPESAIALIARDKLDEIR